MNKWSVYQSDKDYTNKQRTVLGTFELVLWLLFASKQYTVTVNKMKNK